MKLEDLNDPNELYKKDLNELDELAGDVRNFLIKRVLEKGGHIGSSLGVVELTISLLRNYKLDDSVFLFDTGHQSHAYKLLLNGKDKFESLGNYGGMSNFPEFSENKFDFFSAGHSSTALSYALGYSIVSNNKNIFVIIGDVSMMTAYSFGGLINIANHSNKKITIILNDNGQGIGESDLKIKSWEEYFRSLGFEYLLNTKGNDLLELQKYFELADKVEQNIVLHTKTIKALGFENKEKLFENHSVEKDNKNSFTNLMANELYKIFNEDMFLVSPAMLSSSKFLKLKKEFRKNVFDVGINENNAVLLASSLSLQNKKTFVSIFSTFLQRTYDELIHDVLRNNLPITFLIDRAGLSFSNGNSHHGIYDLNIINLLENVIIAQPSSLNDVSVLLELSNKTNKPFFIRYENSECKLLKGEIKFELGEWEKIIYNPNYDKTIFTYGSSVFEFKKIIQENNLELNLINSRFIKPIDLLLLKELENTKWYIYEQVINKNNLYSNIKKEFNYKNDITSFAFDNFNISHGNSKIILEKEKMDHNLIIKKIIGGDNNE